MKACPVMITCAVWSVRSGAVALSHRAILTPQIFRHEAEDRRQDSHQSSNAADNRITFVPIFETGLNGRIRSHKKFCGQ
jgi:hypothetical protein